ncbi:hypothetical protein LCGC14_1421590 [marine sediment metagenome]|uniref:Uncharacterized protein n=1 Tax=marine sediment metagenome TaxID=412755 RepID=A0A0F9M6S2_9ZZZZ
MNPIAFRFIWILGKIAPLLPLIFVGVLLTMMAFLAFWVLPLLILSRNDSYEEQLNIAAELFSAPTYRIIIVLTVDSFLAILALLLVWLVPKYKRDRKRGR